MEASNSSEYFVDLKLSFEASSLTTFSEEQSISLSRGSVTDGH